MRSPKLTGAERGCSESHHPGFIAHRGPGMTAVITSLHLTVELASAQPLQSPGAEQVDSMRLRRTLSPVIYLMGQWGP